jgi:hypothetical protein
LQPCSRRSSAPARPSISTFSIAASWRRIARARK